MVYYFDHNATAPLAPEVLEVMTPYLREAHGNPASRHTAGREAYAAVERARAQVAAAINARPAEVYFTSSGTESNNHIIKGVATNSRRRNIVTSAVEHPCVHCSARAMVRRGHTFTPVAVDVAGQLDFVDLAASVDSNTSIVSVMLANNESGVLQDVARACTVAHAAGSVMHTDAAQALGKIPVDFAALGVDAMTISGHKARGPMGVACLVMRAEVDCEPLLEGGGQESGMRSGTLNVPGIVGFGKAAELAAARAVTTAEHFAALRDTLECKLMDCGAQVFGVTAPRLPNTSYFGIPGIEGEALVVLLDQAGFAVASGSACASTKNDPSHVLMAMDIDEQSVRTAVRVSLGVGNDAKQVDALAQAVAAIAQRLKAMSAIV